MNAKYEIKVKFLSFQRGTSSTHEHNDLELQNLIIIA